MSSQETGPRFNQGAEPCRTTVGNNREEFDETFLYVEESLRFPELVVDEVTATLGQSQIPVTAIHQ